MVTNALVRAHTPPLESDGISFAGAVLAARYLLVQAGHSRIVLWIGQGQNLRRELETTLPNDALGLLSQGRSAQVDGLHFEAWVNQDVGDAVLLAVCIDRAELDQLLQVNVVHATIFVPRSEEGLREYLRDIPHSEAISWAEEAREEPTTSTRTEQMRQDIAWYEERYQMLAHGVFGDKNGHTHVSHDGTGRCRYCGRSEPEVTFRSKAHAFPEQIGNKTLIDPAECDACNFHFGKMLDDDFAKWTQPWRTLLRVNGGSGIPTTKSRDQKMRIEGEDASKLKLFVHAGDERHIVDTQRNRLKIAVDRPSYTPMGVFKCLVKMALSVMPKAFASECDHLKKWILEPDHTALSYPYRPLNVLLQLIAGPTPNLSLSYALMCRKSNRWRVPYITFVLQFANVVLQIALPMPQRDEVTLSDEPLELLPFPHVGGLKAVESQFGRSAFRLLDMSGVERVKDDSETTSFRYAQRIEVDRHQLGADCE